MANNNTILQKRLYNPYQIDIIRKYNQIKKDFPQDKSLAFRVTKKHKQPKFYIKWCKTHLGPEWVRWVYLDKKFSFKTNEDKVLFVLSCL